MQNYDHWFVVNLNKLLNSIRLSGEISCSHTRSLKWVNLKKSIISRPAGWLIWIHNCQAISYPQMTSKWPLGHNKIIQLDSFLNDWMCVLQHITFPIHNFKVSFMAPFLWNKNHFWLMRQGGYLGNKTFPYIIICWHGVMVGLTGLWWVIWELRTLSFCHYSS